MADSLALCTLHFSGITLAFCRVTSEPPFITVIIPTRPDLGEIKALEAARRLDYPSHKLEIIVARGTQPSRQRNAALKSARGEFIYFLDDDSVALPQNLQRALTHFADPAVKMAGGPNLCPPDAPPLEQAFASTMSSWLAFGPSSARYHPAGAPRPSSEKELILCNLLARRDALLELGGFDESLYPNEENALMDELQKRGGKLIYDPALIVHRRPRRTLKAFCKMLFNYGRGRAEQFRLHPTPGSAANFVPPLFCVYLLVAPFLKFIGALTFLAYWVVVFGYSATASVRDSSSRPQIAHVSRVAAFTFLTHVFYGLGFWRGLGTRLKHEPARSGDVTLERFPPDVV